MADTVAIVSVVSSATVAVGVPFVSARLERRRLRFQSLQARFDDLRGLLDASAMHVSDALSLLWDYNDGFATPERRAKAKVHVTERYDEVYRDGIRLTLRLGTQHSICVAHKTIVDDLMHLEGIVRCGGELQLERIGAFTHEMEAFMEACRDVLGLPAQGRL